LILSLLITENRRTFKISKKLKIDVIINDIMFPIISPDEIDFIPKITELSELEDDFNRLCSEIVVYFFSLLRKINIDWLSANNNIEKEIIQ
tara:strand:- start:15 stop:287 length:273 start_codon:yes stop_codon:yes gene_type:complete